jgi:hypothetical protein
MNDVILTAKMSEALAHRARIAAALLGISRSELVRQAVQERVERELAGGAGQLEPKLAEVTPCGAQ